MQNTIATWMYCEQEGEESHYPQVGGVPSSDSFQRIYWRCVAVFFASARRTTPAAQLQLFTNTERLPVVDGIDLSTFLASLGVKISVVPFTFKPPAGYYGSWRNQFYILDILRAVANAAMPGSLLLLDSDCVFLKSADLVFERIQRNDIITYDIDYPPNHRINGLTRIEMQGINEALGEVSTMPYARYAGGEFLGATLTGIQELAAGIDRVWASCLDRHASGLPKFNEEAHFLSYLYTLLDVPEAAANPFVRRIWTGPGHRDVKASDSELIIWHVPAEKRYGLMRLFRLVTRPDSQFWQTPLGAHYVTLLGRHLGVPKYGLRKRLLDFVAYMTKRLAP